MLLLNQFYRLSYAYQILAFQPALTTPVAWSLV